MATYTTKQGDTWDVIAKRELGCEYFMHLLIEHNYEYRDIQIFSQGTKITIPVIDKTKTLNNEQLPPWKR